MKCSGKELYERRLNRLLARAKSSSKRTAPNLKKFRRIDFWAVFADDLCSNSSFHGLNHFTDQKSPIVEKVFWCCLLLFALCGAVFSSLQIWRNYLQSATETVVETTYYKNADVAFPAVIICDTYRVDWSRLQALNESVIPEYTKETEPAIRTVLQALSVASFGNFDELNQLESYMHVLPKLKTLKLSELLLKVVRPCTSMFIGECWWRSHRVDCCLIFELQKTEFGYCYSFNSDLSEHSKKISQAKDGINSYWRDPDGILRPRRTGGRGLWSGLRVTINASIAGESSMGVDLKPGVKILIGEPRSYVMGAEINIAAGQFGIIHISGNRIYSTDRMRNMAPAKRHCHFSDELSALGLPYYLRQNCKTHCYKTYAFKHCGCVPDFMFFELSENNPTFPPCTVEDLLCLSKYNTVFNNMIPNFAHDFFDTNESGMMCDCLADCTHQMYNAEFTAVEDTNSTQEIFLDIHFKQATCILYRSDVMFGFLDLIASFGGCTGLFLGGSLLSCVELLYFLTVRLYYHWQQWKEDKHASEGDKSKIWALPKLSDETGAE